MSIAGHVSRAMLSRTPMSGWRRSGGPGRDCCRAAGDEKRKEEEERRGDRGFPGGGGLVVAGRGNGGLTVKADSHGAQHRPQRAHPEPCSFGAKKQRIGVTRVLNFRISCRGGIKEAPVGRRIFYLVTGNIL